MRKVSLLTLINLITFFNSDGQELEKNLTGVQVGLFGLNIYNETKIVDKLAILFEAELKPKIWSNSINNINGFILYPILKIEPRYYYNLNRRFVKDKDITNNSANYFSIQLEYIPDIFVISNINDLKMINQINIIPTYGFKRNFSRNFNYEFNVGLGYAKTIDKNFKSSGTVFDLNFKVGYIF